MMRIRELVNATCTIALGRDAEAVIRWHAQRAYPDECCGALIGSDGHIDEAVPLPNATSDVPSRRFVVGPDAYRVAERRAADRGGELVGFYHSHPDAPARPSHHDLEQAWPSFVYVIVAVEAAAAADLTVWQLRSDRSAFDEVPVTRR